MLGLVRVPVAWFASRPFGPTGVWAAFAVSNVVGAVIAYAWFRRSDWSAAVIDQEKQRQAEVAEEAVEYGDTIEAD